MASSHRAGAGYDAAGKQTGRSIWSGVLAGIGLVAFIDETVFHQLLHWHHFYDKSTLAVGLVSDGLFHAGGFIAMVAGLFLLADVHRRGGFVPKRCRAACCPGSADSSSTTGSCSTSCSDCTRSLSRHHLALPTAQQPMWRERYGPVALIGIKRSCQRPTRGIRSELSVQKLGGGCVDCAGQLVTGWRFDT